MAKKKTSKAPSGLSISRNKDDFTCSWKLGEKYKSQTFQYCVATSFKKNGDPKWPTKKVKVNGKTTTQIKWTSLSVGAGTTSKTIKDKDNIAGIQFHVKGQANKKNASDFIKKEFVIKTPKAPAVGVSIVNDYTSYFSWETPVSNDSTTPFKENQWQNILVTNCNITDGDKITGKWSSLSTSTKSSGYSEIEESGWDSKNESRTRWLRVRSKGWASLYSKWIYKKRVYAIPNPAKNVSATRSPFSGSGYSVVVNWTSPETVARPIDVATVEYTKVQPNVTVVYPETSSGTVTMTMSCPNSGVSWSSVIDAGGIANNRTVAFTDFDGLPNDSCFYVTIANKHDNNITRSTPVLASGGKGLLTSPSAPSASPTGTPKLYTISVSSRGTSINNAAIAVYFRTSSEQNKIKCIGIIPPGDTYTNCIIPDVPSGDTFSFGVKAFVGDYSPKQAPSGSTTSTEFKPVMQMSSETVWGDEVPLPPDITAEPADESTIQVSWTWSWTDATQAELSWSDHLDAWESTDEPQTYIVNSVNASRWRIAGLGIGTWYVRVRLIKPGADSASYSAYSETKTVKLASSPDIPSLLLSSGTISKTGSVTCYWAYVSGDGTGQRQAQIFEAFPEYAAVDNPTGNPYENVYYERSGETAETYKYTRSRDTSVVSGKTYYQPTGTTTYSSDPLASTESAQHITLHAEDYGWESGETHHLSVRVMSMSGEQSAGYSAPAPVTIADELSIAISSTSLVVVNVPSDQNLDDEVVEYRSAFSMTQFPLEFTIDGYSEGSIITCIIDRSESYKVDRPDESEYEGFIGETVLMKDFDTSNISIEQEDLIGNFDDGASYRVTMILNDAYGQNVQTSIIPMGTYTEVEDPTGNPSELGYYVLVNNEYVLTTDTEVIEGTTYYTKDFAESFEIHWTHQAVMPSAVIELDKENNVTMISPIQPESGYIEGDVVDIYRLSADPPELIYAGAIMTDPPTKYVDPYPAFGEFGGHRIVYRTINGDYITENNELAMTDYAADENEEYKHDLFGIVIDFDGMQIILPGDVSFSNRWSKDFTLTKYLGGSIQGDWNPAVERTMSANTTISVEFEPDNIEAIRRLAIYPGICHVRTPDGSSFAANIDVTEDREEKWTRRKARVSLDITKCDPEGSDAMTYAEWVEEQE